ncbi:Nuclear factor NF-kappa-B subunit [Oopsacas minuta]|uniref:Nuclear factor NF-kappa-B subunit n=1 Tax=Oopsacas minuta TaxID=111878 RepID=A0AAV7JT57_9METZ|nr:Nuclear factor NF-kappa-B subunit [Oopsacas minuta]
MSPHTSRPDSETQIEEYLEWVQKELLCRELEVTQVAYFDKEEIRGLGDMFLLLVWTPLSIDTFSTTEMNGSNSTLVWLQQNILSNKIVNLYTHNSSSYTLPNWASYFRKFYLPIHSSTAALGSYLKLEPSSKLNSQSRVDWKLEEDQAKHLLRIADPLELHSLHRLIPHANKSSDKAELVPDNYIFKEYRTLLWYMLNIGYLKADTVIEDFSYALEQYYPKVVNGIKRVEIITENGDNHPTVIISEQPKSQGYRFRYECEGYTHGGIPGEYSERGRKTHPTLLFNDYEGRVIVVGYLVGDEGRCQHANSLVGRDVHRGVMVRYGVVSSSSPKMLLGNISIQHCKKKLITQSAEMQLETRRLVEKIGVDALRSALASSNLNGTGSESALEELIKKHLTEEDYKEISLGQERNTSSPQNLSAVKLSLIIYTQHKVRGEFTELSRLTTHSIFDSQSVHSSSPRICKINVSKGNPEGSDEILILCEKIQKNDIEVIFSEERDSVDNEIGWYQNIAITSNDVHHQYAVSIKTPSYTDINIKRTHTVFIRLRRLSDSLYSNPIEFYYEPELRMVDPEGIGRKRKKEESLDRLIRY